MKINKSISELAQTNFIPLEETKEGLLRGGFGEISDGTRAQEYSAGSDNCTCGGNNCNCVNHCPYPEGNNCSCSGKTAPNNNCKCGITTTTSTTQPPVGLGMMLGAGY